MLEKTRQLLYNYPVINYLYLALYYKNQKALQVCQQLSVSLSCSFDNWSLKPTDKWTPNLITSPVLLDFINFIKQSTQHLQTVANKYYCKLWS